MNLLRIRVLLPAVAALFLLAAASAGAAVVPPGNSAANQYTETYPGAGGQTTPGSKRGKTQTPEQALGAGTAERLAEEGAAGRALGEVVAETAPAGARKAEAGDGKAGGGDQAGDQAGSGGSSGLREVVGQATGTSSDDGLGLFLPILIVLTLAGAAAYWVARHRGAGHPPEASG